MAGKTIVVLEGDQTGQELLEEALRTLAPDVIGVELGFPRYDLSLESRRATGNAIVHEAAAAIREAGLGLKAATVTPEGAGDVGSPNRILREEIGGRVIVRTGRRIPGSSRLAACTLRSRSCAWPSVTRTARRSGARAKARTRSRSARSASNGRLPCRRGVRVPPCRAHRGQGLRRAEVHGQPGLRGDAQGGDGRGRGAACRGAVRAAADRRDVRAVDRLERRPARDPGAQSRRGHPLRPRPPPVRLDRRLGVAARRASGTTTCRRWCSPRPRTERRRRCRARTSRTRWR